MSGATCVGDLRLAPLDVGFDLRVLGMEVILPKTFASVGLEWDGDVYLIEGTREEMIAAIGAAGYRWKEDRTRSRTFLVEVTYSYDPDDLEEGEAEPELPTEDQVDGVLAYSTAREALGEPFACDVSLRLVGEKPAE